MCSDQAHISIPASVGSPGDTGTSSLDFPSPSRHSPSRYSPSRHSPSRLDMYQEAPVAFELVQEDRSSPIDSSCKLYLDSAGSNNSPSINPVDSLVFTLPDYYRTSPMNQSSSSSVSDARSPTLEMCQDSIVMPSMDINNPLKKVPSPKNGDPINTSDSMVSITRSRLEELEYIEKNIDEIVAYNLRKYIEEHENDSE